MIRRIWCSLVLLLIQYFYSVKGLQCPKVSNCRCFSRFNEREIILKCSKGDHEITVTSNDAIRIRCMNLNVELKMSVLPPLNISDGNELILNNCLVRENFIMILKKFNITNIRQLYLENSTHYTVSKSSFFGINQLEKLTITFGQPRLEYDFLKNLSNLRKLRLSATKLTMITWSLEYLHSLDYLELSRNRITKLPDYAFEKLKKLETLFLWMNNIEEINKYTFIGLENLKILMLTDNKITYLPNDVLIYLSALICINFSHNKVVELHSDTFKMNRNLINITMDNNNISILGDYLLSNFSSLIRIDLNNNQLTNLPEMVFTNSSTLKYIHLQNNKLRNIPEKLFATLKKLTILNLANNHLTEITKMTFNNLTNLKSLFLQDNRIVSISEIPFWSNIHLQILNLSNNILTSEKAMPLLCQKTINALTTLDISQNNLSDITYLRYKNCSKLENMYLQGNRIKNVSLLELLPSFKEVDLSLNNVSEISVEKYIVNIQMNLKLRNNQIERLDFLKLQEKINQNKAWLNKDQSKTLQLDIRHNPIICDCRNYYLFDYNTLDTFNLRRFIDIEQEGLVCHNNNDQMTKQVNVSMIYCNTHTKCPENCTCVARPMDKSLIIDCSSQNLTKYPKLEEFSYHERHLLNQTILILRDNNLTNGPSKDLNYSNIIYLDLSYNKINNFSWIPPNVKILNLKRNNLTILDSTTMQVLKQTKNLENLMLNDNPWSCSQCESLEFQKTLITLKVVNFSNVLCEDSRTLLIKATISCVSFYSHPYIIIPIILTVLLLCMLIQIFYYKNKLKIRKFLYGKNLCCGLIISDPDNDLKYDIFLSYSHEDEQFILEEFLPELEKNNFKVCIHIRDWIPGKSIMGQIVESIQNSKRTIVILSEQYTKSTWGLVEFRTAHVESAHKRSKVIVLKLDDLNEECMDDEIKSYIKMNTYLKWNDEYFWVKLQKAINQRVH